MKILQSLLYGLALAGPQQDDTEEMCGGVSRIRKKKILKCRFTKNNDKMVLTPSKVNFRLIHHSKYALQKEFLQNMASMINRKNKTLSPIFDFLRNEQILLLCF